MHRARGTVLIVITRTTTPMVTIIIASIDNLQRDRRTARDTIIVGIEAARRQLKALTACSSTVRLACTIQATLEELLIYGAVVDAGATRPLPGVLTTVTGASLPAIVLR